MLDESNDRGKRAVDFYSARSVPNAYCGGAAAVDGRHPGIEAESLRIADTIRANAVATPAARCPRGVTSVESLNTGVAT
ncbi:hypothetical protein [Burkholderia orbicola]|uniref:hypothetical protein n=1 Tax=Burkholderia orbicola TaxID=2978683 RepID=UPI002FE2E18B